MKAPNVILEAGKDDLKPYEDYMVKVVEIPDDFYKHAINFEGILIDTNEEKEEGFGMVVDVNYWGEMDDYLILYKGYKIKPLFINKNEIK